MYVEYLRSLGAHSRPSATTRDVLTSQQGAPALSRPAACCARLRGSLAAAPPGSGQRLESAQRGCRPAFRSAPTHAGSEASRSRPERTCRQCLARQRYKRRKRLRCRRDEHAPMAMFRAPGTRPRGGSPHFRIVQRDGLRLVAECAGGHGMCAMIHASGVWAVRDSGAGSWRQRTRRRCYGAAILRGQRMGGHAATGRGDTGAAASRAGRPWWSRGARATHGCE